MPELHAFLLWLILVVISAIAIGYFIKYYSMTPESSEEGFIVYTCPSGSTKYISKNGETNCCNGDIVNGECNGNNLCSLSPTNTLGLLACQDYVTGLRNDAAVEHCFSDVPFYFASTDGSLRGCSASPATPDGTGPSDENMTQCTLYATAHLDKVRLDSCYNYNINKNNSAKAASCPVQKPPSVASSVMSSIGVGSPSTSATGYVMYGDEISGNLAVTKAFDAIGPGGSVIGRSNLAQDGNYIRVVNTNVAYTTNNSSFYFTGNLSEIDDFAKLNMASGRVGITFAKYNIKKADGSGILLAP